MMVLSTLYWKTRQSAVWRYREFVFEEKFGVQAERGIIYDINGKGHKVGIRWYFPKSKYRMDHVIKIGEEMDLRYKAIREMTCPEDE